MSHRNNIVNGAVVPKITRDSRFFSVVSSGSELINHPYVAAWDPSNFNGVLSTNDNTLQEIFDKLDNLSAEDIGLLNEDGDLEATVVLRTTEETDGTAPPAKSLLVYTERYHGGNGTYTDHQALVLANGETVDKDFIQGMQSINLANYILLYDQGNDYFVKLEITDGILNYYTKTEVGDENTATVWTSYTPDQVVASLIYTNLYYAQSVSQSISGTVNNSGISASGSNYVELTGTGTPIVTGLSFQNRELTIANAGAVNIVFKHQDTGSTASARMISTTGADVTLEPNRVLKAFYSTTAERWRIWKC